MRPTIKQLSLKSVIIILFASVVIATTYLMMYWAVSFRLEKQISYVNTITAQQRQRELNCLARNIYYEAGNEPFEGKVAVAQVTLNRVNHNEFPDDICQVVYQKNIFYSRTVCQFSWYCDSQTLVRPIDQKSYDESMIVAKKVLLEGFRLPSLTTALYYHANYINPNWRKQRITRVGRHIFYK
jgi:spore germination cell wall hydrolase CwlJ-like protein